MCGINGVVRLGPGSPPIDRDEVIRTREAMLSRGPDDAGAWISQHASLASRRLAIQDLSEAGQQPFATPEGRFLIVMNGEIYNFRQLRQELAGDGVNFHSKTDTEVVLYLYLRDGPAMLPRLRGMFGLAIWDDDERRLFLARDAFGVKPLYYSVTGGAGDGLLRFASQVKALAAGGGVAQTVDPAGLAGFLLWGSVPEPFTIRRAIRSLPAGSYLLVEDGRIGEPVPWYRCGACAGLTPAEALEPAAAVEDSVRAHLVSDVPVAVFLSSGLDSSLIAALARRHLAEPPATFTMRFEGMEGTELDEGPLAAEVARALGTRHVVRRMGRADAGDLWTGALAAMDQPSIDGFNTWAVSRAAHEAGLKVVLSGLGGDELFGSYPSFHDVPAAVRAARWAGRVPGLAAAWPPLARLAGARPKLRGLPRFGRTLPGAYFLRRGLFLPEELPALIGRERAAEGLAAYDPVADAAAALDADRGTGTGSDPWIAVHSLETALYMRNQLLRDSDWASMAHSVELRVPLVDPVLRAQIAAHGFEPARGQGKAALVRQAAPELPEALFRRPKAGFYIPLMDWLEPAARRGGLGGRSRRLAVRILEEMGI
jgi:asparagine synthase (glutamine-hydrolysing)